MRLLVQKELQGREQECREFHNLNVRLVIFCERKETCNNKSLTKFFFTTASSRSGSPSSRLSYATYNREGESLIGRPRRLSGHTISSTSNSREPSPQRFGMDRSFASKLR